MQAATPSTRGCVDVRGYRTWRRVTGGLRSRCVPLLLLHGVRGMPGPVLGPFEALAEVEAAAG